MPAPKISVLVPTRNYARYLPEALDSVLGQDCVDLEILISDNASTDATPEVTARYAARDQRIRVHRHEKNLGMVQNFNWCLHQARGEYIKYLFGDDRLDPPGALRQLAGFLDENPSAVLAGTARQVIDDASQPMTVWDDFSTAGLHPGARVIARCLQANANLVGEPSAVMFRHAQARAGFDPEYRQLVDLELWLRLLEKGDFFYSPTVLSSFRRHGSQQSEVNRADKIALVEAARLAWKHLDRCSLTLREKRDLVFRHAHGLRHQSRQNPEALQLRQEMSAWLGKPAYVSAWCRYRLLRLGKDIRKPVQNLRTDRPQPPQH
jgi:glycosyltransferase involved in cell wall biosynthesis